MTSQNKIKQNKSTHTKITKWLQIQEFQTKSFSAFLSIFCFFRYHLFSECIHLKMQFHGVYFVLKSLFKMHMTSTKWTHRVAFTYLHSHTLTLQLCFSFSALQATVTLFPEQSSLLFTWTSRSLLFLYVVRDLARDFSRLPVPLGNLQWLPLLPHLIYRVQFLNRSQLIETSCGEKWAQAP